MAGDKATVAKHSLMKQDWLCQYFILPISRPLGCSVFYSTLLLYGFTLKLFTFSWLIEKWVWIFVDKIDNQLKILWLSTFINKLNL